MYRKACRDVTNMLTKKLDSIYDGVYFWQMAVLYIYKLELASINCNDNYKKITILTDFVCDFICPILLKCVWMENTYY